MSFDQIGVVKAHILRNGFHEFYMQQIFHGQKLDNVVNEVGIVEENVDANEMVDVLNDFLKPTIGASKVKFI